MKKILILLSLLLVMILSVSAGTETFGLAENIGNEFIYNDNYASADVSADYQSIDTNFKVTIDGTGLKPGFTYQVKLIGTPSCAGGDDASNEKIGYSGRWYCPTCSGDANAKNRDDAQYEANKAKADDDPTKECIYGYLVFGYFVADTEGSINSFDVETEKSYHVLRCGIGDAQLYNVDITQPPFSTHTLKCAQPKLCVEHYVLGEIQRAGFENLPEGDYTDVKIALTEESYHQSCGTWANVMEADVEFTIDNEDTPVECGTELDFVNIGDVSSESGHSLSGWSDVWNWGGNYGGGDDGNLGSQTLRTIVPKSADCQNDDKLAYFSMSTTGTATELKIRHLMGSQGDAYKLYYESSPSTWTELVVVSSTEPYNGGGEIWYTDTYNLPSLTGTVNFKVETFAMPTVGWCGSGPYWCNCYGLNAFSWAKLYGCNEQQIPEFTYIGALLGLSLVAGMFVVLRKR